MAPPASRATIVPNGFFGDQAIAFTPIAPNEVAHAPGDTIPVGIPAAGLQGLLARADTVTGSLSVMMTALRTQFVDSGGFAELRRTTLSMNRMLANFNEIASLQSREIQSTMIALRSRITAVDSARVDSTLRSLQQTAAGFQTLTGDLQNASTRFNSLMTKVESGDGSLAKLLNDPALYNDIRRIAFRLDSVMIDFKANPRKYLKFSVF